MPDVVLRGTFDASQRRRYTHVPFEVPAGVRALHIQYDYSHRIASDPLLRGGNTLDIGLFDTRGIEPSSPGFRGWSGSHRRAFTVSETWATPPYLSGPILPGTWHVLLGPYKVGPRGFDYTVEVTFDDAPGEAESRPIEVTATRPSRSAAAEPGWLRGDLHCHTLFSDGDSWPRDMVQEAVSRGLDFLGVTDHNQVGHHAEYARLRGAQLPILLPGIEVTTYRGHWNAWGTSTWWEFREPTDEAASRAMQSAAASGALVSVNHPKAHGPAWKYSSATGYHAIEVWNGSWLERNAESLRWWDQHLRAGRRVVALGGSDTHVLKDANPRDRLGRPTTWARAGADASADGVLAALRGGHAFISRDVDGPQLYLARAGAAVEVHVVEGQHSALLLITEEGIVHAASVDRDDWRDRVDVGGTRFVRAQLVGADSEVLALSNPL
jgi:hypothetical protein